MIDVLSADGRAARAGVVLHPGDAFADLAPGPFDLVLCGTFTNMFTVDRVRDILQAVRGILAPGGRIAIATWMRDRGPVGAAFGVQMLVATDGCAHSADAYEQLLHDCGYSSIELVEVAEPPMTVMTAQRSTPS